MKYAFYSALGLVLTTLTVPVQAANSPVRLVQARSHIGQDGKITPIPTKGSRLLSDPDDMPVIEPIRQAKAQIEIHKTWWEMVRHDDGHLYTYTRTAPICSATIDVPVFDLRPNPEGMILNTHVECETYLKEEGFVKVSVSAFEALMTQKSPAGRPLGDVKAFQTWAYTSKFNDEPLKRSRASDSVMMTPDLNFNHPILQLSPNGPKGLNNEEGSTSEEEIAAFVDILDENSSTQ